MVKKPDHKSLENAERDRRRQTLRLTPNLVEALEILAEQEGLTLEQLLIDLVNEALAYRLRHRHDY